MKVYRRLVSFKSQAEAYKYKNVVFTHDALQHTSNTAIKMGSSNESSFYLWLREISVTCKKIYKVYFGGNVILKLHLD